MAPPSVISTSPSARRDAAVIRPPAAAGVDYQLGGAYPPPDGLETVVRDRTDA